MTHTARMRNLRISVLPRLSVHWLRMGLSLMLSVGTVLASVPASNELGIHFKVLRSGPPATVEIRIAPRRHFDSIAVEPASGAASVTSSCAFTKGEVAAGKFYSCQVEIAGRPSEAAMTINVVARRNVPGGTVPVMEVHHLTVKNSAFAISQKSATASHHDVAESVATPK